MDKRRRQRVNVVKNKVMRRRRGESGRRMNIMQYSDTRGFREIYSFGVDGHD